MTDVRLTALNPVDSQVYPVACNTSGELIVEQVDPGPDLTVTGNLTVNGTSTLTGDVTSGSQLIAGVKNTQGVVMNYQGYAESYVSGVRRWGLGIDGSGNFLADVSIGSTQSSSGNGGGILLQSDAVGSPGLYIYAPTASATTPFFQGKSGTGDGTAKTTKAQINTDGSCSFAGDITCSDNTKGLVLKSPNGTSYRLTVANDGTLGTE